MKGMAAEPSPWLAPQAPRPLLSAAVPLSYPGDSLRVKLRRRSPLL